MQSLVRSAAVWRWIGLVGFALLLTGCGGPPMAPVKGKVSYKGKPLTFGNVMFQPPSGQPANGVISSDGTFELSTYEMGDGAVVGKHFVRISCYDIQNPSRNTAAGNEAGLGKSLIPLKYTEYTSSGLNFEVKAGDNLAEFNLEEAK